MKWATPRLKIIAKVTHTTVQAIDSLKETTCVLRWNTPRSKASIARTNRLKPTQSQIDSVMLIGK